MVVELLSVLFVLVVVALVRVLYLRLRSLSDLMRRIDEEEGDW